MTDQYTVVRLIGEGSYGKAVLCTDKQTNKLVVMKEIPLANLTEQEKQAVYKETKILKLFNHPNIIGYRDSFIENNTFHIVMEYADGGDLGQKISSATTNFSENDILHWFVQICLALKHTHDRKTLHRDLKTQNIFLTKSGMVKLGDFGISTILDQTTSFAKTAIGTPYYLSPEICDGKPYNSKSDIWSLGCVLYEMCTLRHPFDSNCLQGLVIQIMRAKPKPIPSVYSSELQSLIDSMLNKRPNKRPEIKAILDLPFIRKRISQLLTKTQAKLEFSHTVFHGVEGGITPEEFSFPGRLNEEPVPKTDNVKPPTSARKSQIPIRPKSGRNQSKEKLVQEEKAESPKKKQTRNDYAAKLAQKRKELRQHEKEAKKALKHHQELEAPFKEFRKQMMKQNMSNQSETPNSPVESKQSEPTLTENSDHSSEQIEDDFVDFSDDFIDFDDEDGAAKGIKELEDFSAVLTEIHENQTMPSEEMSDESDEINPDALRFTFQGTPLPIPANEPRAVQNEHVRKFIENNLGADKFIQAYRLMVDHSSNMTEAEFQNQLESILTTSDELDYCPLIRQLIISELTED